MNTLRGTPTFTKFLNEYRPAPELIILFRLPPGVIKISEAAKAIILHPIQVRHFESKEFERAKINFSFKSL